MPMGYGPLNTPSINGSSCKTLLPSSVSTLNRWKHKSDIWLERLHSYNTHWVIAPVSHRQGHLRPVASHSSVKHWPDAPARAEHVEGLGEAVVVNDARVDREDSHQQDYVAPCKHHAEHLPQSRRKTRQHIQDISTENKKSSISAIMSINK